MVVMTQAYPEELYSNEEDVCTNRDMRLYVRNSGSDERSQQRSKPMDMISPVAIDTAKLKATLHTSYLRCSPLVAPNAIVCTFHDMLERSFIACISNT